MMTWQPAPRQHDLLNSNNTTPKKTMPYQDDKAQGEHSEQYTEMYRSVSQHNYDQQRNETWRKQKEERWTTRQGHIFAATGVSEACHGTATLINNRWTKHIKEVQHSGPRLTIEKKKFRRQVSSVYFPHTGYGDGCLRQVYSELQKHTDRCRKTLQRACRIKRRTRRSRLQIHRKTRTRRAKQQRLKHWVGSTRSKTTAKPRTTQLNNASSLTVYS